MKKISGFWGLTSKEILHLIGLISVAYLPVLGFRLLRTAGDEKVYASQALEMAKAGRWFVQTLHDVPDYYKGPFHYIALRLGMMLFGLCTWTTIYMNYLLILAGALSVAALVNRYKPHWKGAAVFSGSWFALNLGIYSHASASQMEVELASIFAIGLYFLSTTKTDARALRFWITAGILGWVKSPLHSVFLGVTGVLFWAVDGQLIRRLKNQQAWLGVTVGVLTCLLGYLPALLLDHDNLIKYYVRRETLEKSTSGQRWSIAMESTLGFYLFPWLFAACAAYFHFIFKIKANWKQTAFREPVLLGLCALVPSVAFFIWHPYRFENYNLPVISGVILWLSVLMASAGGVWPKIYRMAWSLSFLLFLLVPSFVTALWMHFRPMPDWWPAWLVALIWLLSLTSLYFLFMGGIHKRSADGIKLAWSSAFLYLAIGVLIAVLGEREIRDLRKYRDEIRSRGDHSELTYYNLQRNIWSEWGMLSFWIGERVQSLHTPELLKQAVEEKAVILVPSGESTENFKAFMKKEKPYVRYVALPWRRWRTRGSSPSGKPLWKEAWDQRDLTVLEREYMIVRVY